jgi:purine-binding chemotaxis protein CheW
MQQQEYMSKKEDILLARERSGKNRTQFLTFDLAGKSYGIDILNIKEIIEHGNITRVPMTQNFLAGVINLRGNVVPVVDLALRFSQARSKHTRKSGIVILELKNEEGSLEIGVTVDLVNEVLEVSDTEVKSAPSFGTNIRSDFISGIVKLDERLLVLLDIEQILSIDELSA